MEVRIETIEDVLPHIREDSGIIVSKRPDHTVIDYVFSTDETFDSPMALQCRGLKFDAAGRIIARPFHKFFNMGEREDPLHLDWSRPHVVADKLDGTMVHAAMLNGALVFMTRMGATEHARAAEAVASEGLLALCREQLAAGRTPIFEYTGPDNRIVVAYEAPRLTLLAVRETVSGRYLLHDGLVRLGARFGVPVVETFGGIADIKAFIAEGRALEAAEGYVVAFDDGHRLKLKADGYVLRHRALASLHLEKNVLAWVATRAVDDVLPLLAPAVAERVLAYQAEVEAAVTVRVDQVEAFFAAHREMPRRDFAQAAQRQLDKALRAAAFGLLDGKDAREMVTKHLVWASQSQTRIDEARPLYGFSWSTEGLAEPEAG